eukprot:scaffold31492_cov25-Tisochrysis_lutea.AAC.1
MGAQPTRDGGRAKHTFSLWHIDMCPHKRVSRCMGPATHELRTAASACARARKTATKTNNSHRTPRASNALTTPELAQPERLPPTYLHWAVQHAPRHANIDPPHRAIAFAVGTAQLWRVPYY